MNKLLLLVFITLYSCNHNNEPRTKPILEEKYPFSSELDYIDSLIDNKNDINSTRIIRFGSIEGISGYSILEIWNKDSSSTSFTCKYTRAYFSDDFEINMEKQSEIYPTFITFYFSVKKHNLDIRDLTSDVIFQNRPDFEKYIHKHFSERKTEGYGGNIYAIYKDKSSKIGVLDANKSKKAISFAETIFRQISLYEYIQTFALKSDYYNYEDSVSYLMDKEDSLNSISMFKVRRSW